MRHFLFLILLLISSLAACKKDNSVIDTRLIPHKGPNEMDVSQKPTPILFKITGETCYYCGDWGWQAWIDLADAFKGKAFCWANYGTGFSNSYFRKQELNPTMDILEDNFEVGDAKPNFAANGVDYSVTFAKAKKAAEEFLNTFPNVGVAMQSNWRGDTLHVEAAAKFFKEHRGEYYIGAYVVENNAIGPQDGPIGAAGPVAHHYVMRGSMSNSAWGYQLHNGTIAPYAYFQKSFDVKIPATYLKENLSIGVIVWNKIGDTYSFVNAATNQ